MSERLGDVYLRLKGCFKEIGSDNAGLEAYLLLEWVADIDYKDIVVNPDKLLGEKILCKLEEARARRLCGESVHRIRGWREFYGLPFHLSPDTLEPRPDSEVLVDLILPFIQERVRKQERVKLLDMGTGSGALVIALLSQVPQLHGVGVDISRAAVMMAQQNARLNNVEERFQAIMSDGFDEIKECFDFIISNPPYIARSDIANLDVTVRNFDPIKALDGGEDGLDFYRQLALKSGDFLTKNGFIGIEIAQGKEAQVTALFAFHGLVLVAKSNDLAGICRALLFQCALTSR